MHETTVDGWGRKGGGKTDQRSLKFRILFVIPSFYRPVAFRGGPSGSGNFPRGAPINTQHPTAAVSTYIVEFRQHDMWEGGPEAKVRAPLFSLNCGFHFCFSRF